nr:LCP family protein [Haloechinothrix aidingensis]
MIVVLAVGGAWGGIAYYDDRFDEVSALDPDSPAIQDAAAQQGDSNYLIIGSDTREGLDAEAGHGTEEDIAGSRADTIMLAHVPAGEDRAVFVSFPRDLEIDLDGCEQWDDKTREYSAETVHEAEQVKLAEAYSMGGPRCVTKVIQGISGLRVNHFVGVDFRGFTGMVDAVGGVPVTVEEPIIDDVLGVVIDEPGTHVLSGTRALDFVRARHVHGDPTSDYGRMQRQQQFISALLNSAVSRDVVLDPRRMKRFVTAFTNATFGDNVAMDDMLTLVHSLKSTGVESIDFITVPTTGFSNARGNEVLLEGEASELFGALIRNEPLPGTDS